MELLFLSCRLHPTSRIYVSFCYGSDCSVVMLELTIEATVTFALHSPIQSEMLCLKTWQLHGCSVFPGRINTRKAEK